MFYLKDKGIINVDLTRLPSFYAGDHFGIFLIMMMISLAKSLSSPFFKPASTIFPFSSAFNSKKYVRVTLYLLLSIFEKIYLGNASFVLPLT
jgi:hypothetical protein